MEDDETIFKSQLGHSIAEVNSESVVRIARTLS